MGYFTKVESKPVVNQAPVAPVAPVAKETQYKVIDGQVYEVKPFDMGPVNAAVAKVENDCALCDNEINRLYAEVSKQQAKKQEAISTLVPYQEILVKIKPDVAKKFGFLD